jgi:uridine kinase
MSNKIKVVMNGKALTIPTGTSIAELLPRAPHRGPFQPLGAVINNRIDGLYYELKSNADIETLDLSNREGMDIYRRTASIILYAAAASIAPKSRVIVGQSISNGYFFEIHGHIVDNAFISQLEERMRNIIEGEIPLEPEWITVEQAVDIFRKSNQPDVVRMLEQLRRSEIPLITLGEYCGYAHGPYASRTDIVRSFHIYSYEHGIVLDFPDENGKLAESMTAQPKLFDTYLETKRWNELVNIKNVADLNEKCIGRGVSDVVKVAEALHEKRIAAIADEIADHEDARLVLIAGPSGSGKTTFSKRLEIHLKIHGLQPVALSMDNYYFDREATPRHEDGSYNFECLEALDVELFNDHVQALMKGKEVEIPYYSFPMGRRNPAKATPMKLGKGQVLITEGIHGLNEQLSSAIPSPNKFKIYVSALTQLCLDDHSRIFTTDARLCRRLVRDRLFRGTTAAETLDRWASVRAGENANIFPFQEDADVVFNSALAYEHALLKPYAERYLMEVPRGDPAFVEASRLARFFSFFIPIFAAEVPHTSILREFIGGSAFRYT